MDKKYDARKDEELLPDEAESVDHHADPNVGPHSLDHTAKDDADPLDHTATDKAGSLDHTAKD